MTRAGVALLFAMAGCGRIAFAELDDAGTSSSDDSLVTNDGPALQDAVLWLRFEDNLSDGADDSSGANADASCFTSCPTTVAGRYGNAASFDSMGMSLSAMVTVPTTNFTWTVWVRAASSQPFAGLMSLHGESALGPGGAEIGLLSTVYTSWSNGNAIDSGDPVTLGTWVHVAMVRTATTVIQYLDGVEVNRGDDAVAHDFADCELLIGVDADVGCTGALNGYYDGALDEVRIYDRVLSANEVMSDLASADPVPRN